MTATQEAVARDRAAERQRTVRPARPTRGGGLLIRSCAARADVELRAFFRNRQSLAFTMALPVVLLLVFGAIFTGTVPDTDVPFRQVYIAGILAAGVMSASFTGLAINIAIERDTGVVRRLAATPMPKTAYFVGKIVRVGVTALIETAVMLVVAVLLFHLPLPTTVERWVTLGWVLALGSVSCSLIAVAYSALIPNARSAAAVVTPPFLVLQFISGVFYPYDELPRWMQQVAALLPLKWMAQGFRAVFLPDSFTRVEPAGTWELGRIALVLGLWSVAGLVLCALTFRWRGPRVR